MQLKVENIVAIADSREQWPFNLSPMKMETGSLQTGDYTAKGLESHLRIERKSLEDLIGCLTSGRERFLRELERLMAFPARVVIIEGSYLDLAHGNYRSRIAPSAAVGS